MTELDRAFEMILEWKARKMFNADYQASIGAASADGSFKIGAIDAMVYNMASLVGFNRKTADHANWASYAATEWVPRQVPQHHATTGGDAGAQRTGP